MNKLEFELKKRRLDTGKSLNDFLLQNIGITRPTYDALMKRTHGYSAGTIEKIACYLKKKPSEIIDLYETQCD